MLNGKVALVTGASRGIGKEIAKTLAEAGAYVVVNYNGSREAAEQTVAEIKKDGGDGESICFNVSDFEQTADMIGDIVKRQGHLDILVNNAGITRDDLILKMKESDFDDVVSTNLKGCFNTIRNSARQMLKQKGGVIINISSVSGITGNRGQSNYAASKAGIIGLTKSVAKDLGSRGIRVNAVAPGFIETEMSSEVDTRVLDAAKQQIPLGRLGNTKEVAKVVKFLASEDASYITGQVIQVDGGMA